MDKTTFQKTIKKEELKPYQCSWCQRFLYLTSSGRFPIHTDSESSYCTGSDVKML